MTPNGDDLHMVRLRLETRSLFELAKRRKLSMSKLDTGYVIHCYLKELFGANAPAPFAVMPLGKVSSGRFVTVLGYTPANKEALETHAKALSDPLVYQGCEWPIALKPLPGEWPSGFRIGFQVRACPIVRKRAEGPFHKAGTEVDVFISRCWDVGDPKISVSREQVYGEWFADQIDRIGGAKLIEVRLQGFERERLSRRDHVPERKTHTTEKPCAIFAGSLEVTDSSQFSRLIQRGIGRHRAFGFGMLLLRGEG